MTKYRPVIGLEVHIELETESKMFCECPNDHFRADPNTQTCPVCLGLPGALPYANQKAIDNTIMLGKALGCDVNLFSKFDRKHYFYPDLPKAYQISQYDMPFCENGEFEIKVDDQTKKIRITRIHLEEDTGKLVHKKVNNKTMSLIDFNRSGVPLLELVTEPDFSSTEEATAFMRELQLIVRYLGISGADMEKGSMRLEANVSVSDKQSKDLPDFKVELKNINSFRYLEKAVEAEIKRMIDMLEEGKKIIQETRGYDENKDVTFSQRSKEEAKDYRYFPEPDIPPIELTEEQVNKLSESLSELPNVKRDSFRKLGLPDNYVEVLVSDVERAEFFESAAKIAKEQGLKPKLIANMMVNQNMDDKYKDAKKMVLDIKKEEEKETAGEDITSQAAKKAIESNPQAVQEYKEGKKQVIGFLIGQVMQELKGEGDPQLVREKLQEKLKETNN